MPLWVSFALLALGAGSIFLEIFVPAAGLIGIAGGIGIIAAVAIAYVGHGAAMGTLVLLSAVIMVPIIIILGLRTFPKTWVGKRLILGYRHGKEDEGNGTGREGYEPGAPPDVPVGSEGRTLTDLRPSGTARIAGRKYSVITSGEYLDRDIDVRVIRSEGSRIVVRRMEPPEIQNIQTDKQKE